MKKKMPMFALAIAVLGSAVAVSTIASPSVTATQT
jgi:hypothetical protein